MTAKHTAKHTAEPWNQRILTWQDGREVLEIYHPSEPELISICGMNFDLPKSELEANVKLILLAPVMARLLESLRYSPVMAEVRQIVEELEKAGAL